MSRLLRYRVAALVASGVLFGVPLLTNGTASADQLEPGDRRVTFDGGMLGLSCGSRPSVEKMTVPAESTLHVINRTGHDARLELGGTRKGMIPEDGAAEVVFRRGTTPVLLTPDCSNSDDPVPMLVTAVPTAPSTLPDPVPGDADAGSVPSSVAGSSGQRASGSAQPDTRTSHSRSTRRTPDASHPGSRAPGAGQPSAQTTTSDAATPKSDTAQKTKNHHLRTPGSRTHAFAGMPPGERRTLLPADRTSVAGLTSTDPAVPTSGSSSADVPGVDSELADPYGSDLSGLAQDTPVAAPAAEPVAAVQPMRTGRPIGLLGLTAMVCALGVLVAAIRAIVSQRASRANLA